MTKLEKEPPTEREERQRRIYGRQQMPSALSEDVQQYITDLVDELRDLRREAIYRITDDIRLTSAWSQPPRSERAAGKRPEEEWKSIVNGKEINFLCESPEVAILGALCVKFRGWSAAHRLLPLLCELLDVPSDWNRHHNRAKQKAAEADNGQS